MEDKARWNWLLLLIFVVIGGSVALLVSKELKWGIDLAGGHTFIYEVDVPADRDAAQVVDATIAVLRDRVDPQQVMNLVWRPLAGKRFEVQMPAPAKDVKIKRQRFLDHQKQLLGSNISRGRAQQVLRLTGQDRQAGIEKLTRGNIAMASVLENLANSDDKRQQQQASLDEAQRLYQQAKDQLDALPDDTSELASSSLQSQVDLLDEQLLQQAQQLISAKQQLGKAWQTLSQTNLPWSKVESALSSTDQYGSASTPDDKARSKRQAQLAKLKKQYPGRAEEIDQLAQAYGDYESVKGQLDDPEDFKALMRGSGVLAFRVAPRIGLPDEKRYRTQLEEKGPIQQAGDNYRWVQITEKNYDNFTPSKKRRAAMLENPADYFATYYAGNGQQGLIAGNVGDKIYLLLSDQKGSSLSPHDKGWKLAHANRTSDESGFPAVGFSLNTVGGQLMGAMTGKHIGQHMAIVLDDQVISAPTINGSIHGSGIISQGDGGYAQNEMDYLIRILNAGSLQAAVHGPIFQRSFDAAFGAVNLQQGLRAAVGALVLVALFMLFYYFVNGLIANFALFGNLALILGIMSLFEATFTLSGIAAVVLTIGMAVDANVLIFERIGEEIKSGAGIGPAVRIGYGKALSTIIDANITTMITCLVLYYTATAQVKGFAVTLGIGIAATMFTALLCTRVWLEFYVHLTKARSLPMLPTVVPSIGKLLHPHIDWVGKRFGLFIFSGVLIVASVLLVSQRGEDLLDIEFRSGTQVGFTLKEGQARSIAQIRLGLDDIAKQTGITQLAGDQAKVVMGADGQDGLGRSFTISTLAGNDDNQVSQAVTEAFAHLLNVKQAIHFAKQDQTQLSKSPVYRITSAALGTNIGRADISDSVADYVGGIAIVINQMSPGASVQDITDRINRTSMQPPFDKVGYRKFQVMGLDLATGEMGDALNADVGLEAGTGSEPGEPGAELRIEPDAEDTARAEPLFASVAIVCWEPNTNYTSTTSDEVFYHEQGLASTQWQLVTYALNRDSSLGFVTKISPQISSSMRLSAVIAIVLSLLSVVAYIWLRFGSLRYGFAAIVALVHDVTIAMGVVALAGIMFDTSIGRMLLLDDFKISLPMIAAFLTIVGYSLNDTIVIFDRIRENRGRLSFASAQVINNSVNQTFSRTALTSFTTLLALMTLYLFGGVGVHGFAFTMLVGVMVGTYSSVAIAAPIVLQGQQAENE